MKRSRTLWPLVLGLVLFATESSRTATSQKLDIAVKDRANAYASLAASNQFVAMAWGVGGWLLFFACTGAVFMAGARLLDLTRDDSGHRRRQSDFPTLL